MKIIVEIEEVIGGYNITVGDPKQPGATVALGHAVATTKKSAARRAGELIEAALGEEK